MPQGPGRTQRQITRVLETRGGQMTAIDISRALQVVRGLDRQQDKTIVQSNHRALRVMHERGEVHKIPVEDTLSQWAYTLATPEVAVASFSRVVINRARKLADDDYHIHRRRVDRRSRCGRCPDPHRGALGAVGPSFVNTSGIHLEHALGEPFRCERQQRYATGVDPVLREQRVAALRV